MAIVTVPSNPYTTGDNLIINFTTDATNITDVQLTNDGSNYISATSFSNTLASFDVSSWSSGTYSTCYLKVIYTETSGGSGGSGDSGGSGGSGGSGDSGGSGGSATTELTATILNMQYASAHEVLPNAPIDDVWKDRPREGKGSTIPTQSCTECASGTHTANESYSAGSLWSTFGQWATIYKIKDTNLVENVGVEITDFKMWRYNENTNQWVLVNDTFDYGAFYYETFWDDGSAPLNDHKILSSDKKTYKCLMDSQTSGRCFHPFSAQKKWSDYGFTTNPSYIVAQMKARLIVWDENGADNRANANLCMDVGGDYWIRQGAGFDDQWRHNGDMMIGYYKKITNDWRYVYMTTCPKTWDKGFPCDSTIDNGPGDIGPGETPVEPTVDPIQLNLASTMECTKGEVFNVTYSTNVEAIKHEMSYDGGNTYYEINPTSDGTTYSYSHEAITDMTWNPVTRYIRVTDAKGNTDTNSIAITIINNDPIQLTLAPTMECIKGETFNINYSTNVPAIKHEMSWDGGTNYSEIQVTSNGTNYTYAHEAISDTTWNPVSRWIRVTDANGNTSSGSISITIQNSSVYSLPSETTFTGSNYIDTKVKLFASNTDWTIFIDYQPSNINSNTKQLFGCLTNVNENIVGFYLYMYSREVYLSGSIFDKNIELNINTGDTNRRKIAIRKRGSNIIVNHDTTNTWDIDNGYTTAITYSSHTASLLLGAYNDSSENFAYYFAGTIYQCEVYNEALSDSEITTLLR